ncbi:MAG: hypothetical protein F6K31_25265, partial [Symploca sp. SIO2G7]|nr:hypothetical protein [Symploca sp. SIO2G7]
MRHLHLIQRSDKNTYQLHPLIREFFRYKGEESAEVEEMKQGLAAVMVAVAKEIPNPITLESVENFQPAIPHLQDSHLAPVHKYLIRLIRAINSNTETVKSYDCCLLPVACCLPSQV